MHRSTKKGVQLTNEISLKVNWAGFAEKFVKAITDGFRAFNGDFKAGVTAAVALAGAAKNIQSNIPLGSRALELIILCFAWSFDALRASDWLDEQSAKDAARNALDILKKRITEDNIALPFDFFEQPSTAEP